MCGVGGVPPWRAEARGRRQGSAGATAPDGSRGRFPLRLQGRGEIAGGFYCPLANAIIAAAIRASRS